jgi:hypothetical protein
METDYWVCDIDEFNSPSNLINWFGVASEEHGGIIAYFQTEKQAINFINTLD